jgi:acyl-CoA thioester hydrolase
LIPALPQGYAGVGEFAVNDQSPARPRRPEARPDQFPFRTSDIIRFGDLDPQSHVNNAVFSTYFETGRVILLRDPKYGLTVPGATFVLARVEIDFRKELRWPGTIEIGTAIAEIGRRSFTYAQAIFHEGTCAATGRTTMVLIDQSTRRPRALPDDVVARMKDFALREG